MKKLLAALAAAMAMSALVGCGHFSEEEATLIGHNHGADPMGLAVDGKEVAQLAPNSVANNEIKILVARDRIGSYSYGPSQVDKQVQVSVVFKNLRTSRLSRETYCNMGAKVKTLVIFEPQLGTDGYAYCTTLYTTGSTPAELDRAVAQAELKLMQDVKGGSQ